MLANQNWFSAPSANIGQDMTCATSLALALNLCFSICFGFDVLAEIDFVFLGVFCFSFGPSKVPWHTKHLVVVEKICFDRFDSFSFALVVFTLLLLR